MRQWPNGNRGGGHFGKDETNLAPRAKRSEDHATTVLQKGENDATITYLEQHQIMLLLFLFLPRGSKLPVCCHCGVSFLFLSVFFVT